MLTKDDLIAISDTLGPMIKLEGDKTRKEIKGYIDSNDSIFGEIVKVELAAQKKELVEFIKTGFNETGKIVGRLREEIRNERVKKLEERVKRLELQQLHTSS